MAHVKLPEKMHVITENGEQLLHRLYNMRAFLGGAKTRPLFLSDEKIGRAIKNLMAKFPDFPELDKVQGVELLTSRAKQYVEDLETHYEVLVDAADWRDAAFALLQEVAGNTVALRFTSSIQLSSAFIELAVLYGRLHILVANIADRKNVLGLYARLHQHLRAQVEPNYARVVRWLNECDAPVKRVQDEYRVLNDAIGQVLMSLEPTYVKRRFITQLRRDGALNLILKPEDIARPIQDQYRIDLAYASRMHQWILYGFLFAPGTLHTPQSVELVKFALSEGFNLPVFKDLNFPIHNEFSSLFKNYKSKTINLQKQTKVVKDAAQASTQDAPRKHYEKRIYLRQELEAMWNLFRDKPCLLAPKINVLFAALSMAKDEVYWYFRHIDVIPPEKVKKYYNKQNDIREKKIFSLLYLIDHLVELVKTHKKIIQAYYVEYIAGADLLGLNKVLSPSILQTAGPIISQTIGSIVNELKGVSLDAFNRGTEYNFDNVRDNWMRLEYLLYSSACPLREGEAGQIASRLNLVFIHTNNIDRIDAQLTEYASLSVLWPSREALVSAFDAALVDEPTHALILPTVLSRFPSAVATAFMPEEKEAIGKECVEIAGGCLTKIAARIVNVLASAIAPQYQAHESQLADVHAAYPLLQKRKEWRPPKDFVAPIEPGTESAHRSRPNLENLRQLQRGAFQLASALNERVELVVYDHVFVPREYLRERLAARLREFMRASVAPHIANDCSSISKPSQIASQLHVFLGVLIMIESHVDIDVGDMIREVLLSEFYAKALGRCGRIDWFPEGDIEYSDVSLGAFTAFYTDFVKRAVQNPGHIYAPGRLGFLSRPAMPSHAEDHADLVEIRALVSMVGPYGVKLIERELLRTILANVTSLKEVLTSNLALLEEYSTCYFKPKAVEHVKRFRLADLDNFVSRSITIGNALHLRGMLRDAVAAVNAVDIPFVQSTVETAFMQYNRNTFMFPEFLGVDTLALDAGLDVGVADQYLKVFLRKVAGGDADKRVWDLLPVMYAACFNSTFWREALYRPAVEGYANNVHVLSRCISDLLIGFGAIGSITPAESEIVSLLHKFLEISSVALLRLFRANKNEKHVPNDLPSVMIFLDQFTQDCPLLTKDTLEQYLPYSLIRNMYKDIYENKATKQQEGQVEQAF
eukprot:gene6513-7543_t